MPGALTIVDNQIYAEYRRGLVEIYGEEAAAWALANVKDIPLPLAPPQARSRELLRSILPESERLDFDMTGRLSIRAASGRTYLVTQASTRIVDRRGRESGGACLQFVDPAPVYDRMIAEYLLIRNDEPLYRKTANIFSPDGFPDFSPPWVFAFALLNVALVVNLSRLVGGIAAVQAVCLALNADVVVDMVKNSRVPLLVRFVLMGVASVMGAFNVYLLLSRVFL